MCQHPHVRWTPRIVETYTGELAIDGAVLRCIDVVCGQVVQVIEGAAPYPPSVTLELWPDGQYRAAHYERRVVRDAGWWQD